MAKRKNKEMGLYGIQYAPGKKLCDISYYFLDFVLKNPGCTGGEITDFLQIVAGSPKYNFWVWITSGRFHKLRGRFAYLLSPYHSNMLVSGNRTTPLTKWVYRVKKQSAKGKGRLWTYYPTEELIAVWKNLSPKNKKKEKNKKPDYKIGTIIIFNPKSDNSITDAHVKSSIFDNSNYWSNSSNRFEVKGNIMITGYNEDMSAIQLTNGKKVGYLPYSSFNRMHLSYNMEVL